MQFFVLLIAMAQLSTPAPPAVEALGALDPPEIPLHRVARYRVTATAPADVEIDVEPWPDEVLDSLAVTAAEPVLKPLPDGRVQFTREWVLAPTWPRTYALPARTVLADGVPAATLPAVELVARDLTEEEKAALAAPSPLITLAELRGGTDTPMWPRWLALFAVLAAAAIAWFLSRRGIPQFRTAPSPAEAAYARLYDIDRDRDACTLSCESLFLELSEVLRGYIGARYRVNINEQSTPEFVTENLPKLPVSEEQAGRIRQYLADFDRVKFAQHLPDAGTQNEAVAMIYELVEWLEAEDRAPEQAESRGAA